MSRAVNYFTAFVVFGYYVAATFVSAFACTPVYKSWTPSTPGYCINNGAFLYSTAVVNIATSLMLIGIPLPLLFRTRFRKREVTQLICLVFLGLMYVFLYLPPSFHYRLIANPDQRYRRQYCSPQLHRHIGDQSPCRHNMDSYPLHNSSVYRDERCHYRCQPRGYAAVLLVDSLPMGGPDHHRARRRRLRAVSWLSFS